MKNLLVNCIIFVCVFAAAEPDFKSFEYWRNELKDKDLRYGYYSNQTTLITVNKDKKIFKTFYYDNGNLQEKFSQSIITGKDGDKMKEGDLKTPVGVYDITKRFVPKDQFYGPLAFSLSYPNLLDKLARKTGGGIWIHGYPLDGKRDNDLTTRGCVALKNDLLVEFGNVVEDNAIVLISEDADTEASIDDIALILSSIFEWKNAWIDSDINEYIGFYATDFKRFDGMSIDKFRNMKERIFAKNEKKEIKLSNFSVTPYPNIKDAKIYRVVFDQDYSSASHKFKGSKELYVRLDRGKFKIIIEG